ncbi:hypothetical protein BCR44DRAFT_1015100 [Catenaria anguillulae PL171]|uniref:Uncharacterized protein n=1 Tax=Catenaria anguillulae PL171 TaxID=765915 RepID=A0A1Y2HVK9_9FUNG|nr:hypothetical protein BCR44DRAFT_1015100 [Catenaria anguillulae PL171]
MCKHLSLSHKVIMTSGSSLFPSVISLTLYLRGSASAAHSIPIFTSTCLLVALSIVVYLTRATFPTLTGPVQCRAIVVQLVLAGGLLVVAGILVAFTSAGRDDPASWGSLPSYFPVAVFYPIVAANSVTLVYSISCSAYSPPKWMPSATPMAGGITFALVFLLAHDIIMLTHGVGLTACLHWPLDHVSGAWLGCFR